jgi:hypothetical protein
MRFPPIAIKTNFQQSFCRCVRRGIAGAKLTSKRDRFVDNSCVISLALEPAAAYEFAEQSKKN